MPRIAGVNIPENKRIEISLTYIYGVGRSLSKKILDQLKIDINKKASDLTPKEVNDLKGTAWHCQLLSWRRLQGKMRIRTTQYETYGRREKHQGDLAIKVRR